MLGASGWSDNEIAPSNLQSGKKIYWRAYPGIPDETSFVFNPATGIPANGALDINAVAFYRGQSGAVRRLTYTVQTTQSAAPTFSPMGGTYYNSTGTLNVTIAIPGGDASYSLFYTSDGSVPSHNALTPLGTTKRLSSANGSFLFTLPVGLTTFKALAWKNQTGWIDSTVATAVYSIYKSKSGGGGGGGGDGIGGGLQP